MRERGRGRGKVRKKGGGTTSQHNTNTAQIREGEWHNMQSIACVSDQGIEKGLKQLK
jgi:hypothetical protein